MDSERRWQAARRILTPQWPTWARLRGIGNSALVRATIVVPVIGYMIILNAFVADYLKLHGVEWSHQSSGLLDRLWASKLYLIYFGLMSVGIGGAIYQWKCPHFVKKHGDWPDYVAATAPHTDQRQASVLAKITGADLESDRIFGAGSGSDTPDLIRRYLRQHYAQMASNHPVWRVATAVLFGLGFGLLAIPSAMTAARVAIVLWMQ